MKKNMEEKNESKTRKEMNNMYELQDKYTVT